MGAGGAVPIAGSQGGGYKEGSSPTSFSLAEDIILQQQTVLQTISSPDLENRAGLCTGVPSRLGHAGAAGLEAAAGKCPGGVSPVRLPYSLLSRSTQLPP